MARVIPTYRCNACQHATSKWLGQCPQCHAWNSFDEYAALPTSTARTIPAHALPPVMHLRDVTSHKDLRMISGCKEWDRVIGGGVVPGAFMVLTGDPGIGKSTLLLQIAHALSSNYKTLYISSEESLAQVKGRAERVGCLSSDLLFAEQANIDHIIALAEHHRPLLIIIDSIQNCIVSDATTMPGGASHLRDAAFRLMRLAKDRTIALLLSGHITKEGTMAGPKTLEHMVDTVLYLQGEDRWQTRILRAVKNRFGPIDEIGFFEMAEQGLAEMPNFNEHVLAELSYAPGASLISSLEGTRPLLVELQALTITSHFSMPQRLISGIDQKQVILIAAILEKYLQIPLNKQDIFFKVAGGIKVKSNGADLGIALALLSSYFQKPLPQGWIALGEIGLTGQIKPISQINTHLNEARKFGIKKVCVAEQQKSDGAGNLLKKFATIYDLLSLFPVS